MCALAPVATAQITPPSRGANRAAAARGAAQLPATSPTIALEGAVNPETYRVGPGDVFALTIGGSIPLQETVGVSADGLLVVPSVGTFQAAGRTLAQVRAAVQPALQRQFARVDTDIALAVPRLFYVHVSGAVALPGRHVISATGRVEDALAVATADPDAPFDPRRPQTVRDLARYDEPTERRVERRPALRNVRIDGRDGGQRTVDIARYFATGDTAFNPVLDDGDAVYLPTFDPDREGVYLDGAVERPGTYDWRPGDTARDLLVVSAGEEGLARLASVRRTRPTGTGIDAVEVPIAQAGNLDILPRDGLYAVAAAPLAGQAEVVGEGVRFPGTYPIEEGRTTLAALVEMAGGLSSDALVRGAVLERRARSEPEETVDGRSLRFADRVTPRDLDTLATDLGALSGLPLVGRRFYAQEAVRTPRVAVDVEAALSGGPAVTIQDGDRLVVPRDLGTVRVFGQVVASGYVPYAPGRTAGDYVEAAGGAAPAATDTYVVEPGGRFVEGAGAAVRPGDAVFVDRGLTSDNVSTENLALQLGRDEQQQERDRRQARYQLIQTVFSAISVTISVIVTTVALTRQD